MHAIAIAASLEIEQADGNRASRAHAHANCHG